MSRYLRMAARANEPLPWILYTFLDDEYENLDRAVPMTARKIEVLYETFQRRIESRCRGFLEVLLDDSSDQVTYFTPRVGFFHRAARDFIKEQEVQEFLLSKASFNPERAIPEGYLRLILALPVELDSLSESLREMFVDAIRYADEGGKIESPVKDGAVRKVFEAVKEVVKNSDSHRENLIRREVTSAVYELRASGQAVTLAAIWESGGWEEEFKPLLEPDMEGAPIESLPKLPTQVYGGLEPLHTVHRSLEANAALTTGSGPQQGETSGIGASIDQETGNREVFFRAGPDVTGTGQTSKDPLAAGAREYLAARVAGMETGDARQDRGGLSAGGSEGSGSDWADDTLSANPGYAKSIFSRGMSKTTALSDPASDYVKPAREVLVDFFLEDTELYPLLYSAVADSNIGIDRLSRNFSRLLDIYSVELLAAAISPLQREAAKFVRTSSPYVTRALETRLDSRSGGTEKRFEPDQATELTLVVEERLKAFLEALPNPESSVPGSALAPEREGDMQRSEDAQDKSKDSIDEVFDEDSIVSALSQVKKFLGAGSPIQNLRGGLRRFVLPSSGDAERIDVADNLDPLPNQDPLSQEADERPSFQACSPVFYNLPELIDRLFGHLFNTREPPLRTGLTRERWKCRCGPRLFDDFIELVPGSIQELETELESGASAAQGSSIRAAAGCLRSALTPLLTWASSWLLRRLKPSGSSLGSIIPMHSVGQVLAVAPADEDTSHLLLCIDKSDVRTTLHQKRIEHLSTDRELFIFLRRLYCDYRMPKTWFTLRSIKLLSLSRFTVDLSNSAEVDKHFNICSPDCICPPPEEKIGPEYECNPAPKTKPKKNPPIGQNRLTHYFRNPECIDEKQTTIYDQLPKRICGELKATAKQEEEGWGLHFEEGWHWRTIFTVTAVFLLSFSLVFGVVWSVTRSDIQGAFAVSSFWLTFGSVLLGFLAARS